jgi:serine/threonine-protein kinase RsbW
MNGSIKIPSDMSNIFRVENLIDSITERMNLGNELIANISVSIIEAVSNAIQHGNKNDITKIVHLEYMLEGSLLTFIIVDEGEGFNEFDVPDPTLPENIENLKGRGLFLIKHLADQVSFDKNGSIIRIRFKI